jgi:hypothetical protein
VYLCVCVCLCASLLPFVLFSSCAFLHRWGHGAWWVLVARFPLAVCVCVCVYVCKRVGEGKN